jgi:HEPN domain-containing protein
MKPIVQKWIEISNYDFKTARAMFKSSRYLYVAFMCQQAIEKIIKALIVHFEDEYPPKIHKLETLAIQANLQGELNDEQKELLNELSFFYLNNRYPDFKAELNRLISKKKALEILKKTEDFLKWMKRQKLK